MASFLWGSSHSKRKYHWVKWSHLCYPTEEGGLGIRSLSDIEKAFSIKLWWKWKTGDSLWANFFRSRYPRGLNMVPKVYDSPIWRRICSINEFASTLCGVNSDGSIFWEPTASGVFSLKSAYEEVRDERSSTFSAKLSWHPKLPLKIRLFLWRLLNGSLPISDNLSRFQTVMNPSICPLCRAHSDVVDHVFFGCTRIRPVWDYFMGIFGVSISNQTDSIRHVLISWWIQAGSKTLDDIFKHCLPGIIGWHIWRSYTSLVWGTADSGLASASIIQQIKQYTCCWVTAIKPKRLWKVSDTVFQEQLVPKDFRLGKPLIKSITWLKPRNTLKLNIDASYLSYHAAGGAILRDSDGKLVVASSFPISASSSFEAELVAVLHATSWVISLGFRSFQVEIDAMEVLEYLQRSRIGRRRDEVNRLMELSEESDVSYSGVLREANWTAHYLASADMGRPIIISNVADLPNQARNAYYSDLFGLSSLRFTY
ncbi:unnamed protein product [Cuscuta epithymum]|uniref:Reverse transcriptase zinc-binding domain-containing protein n=1 Tax=Cuscuta epithymum TaxID=186058 RepID=A0AAV0DZ76_9ASTE|nr:unnamed protein product [Cuscuta epithymum]